MIKRLSASWCLIVLALAMPIAAAVNAQDGPANSEAWTQPSPAVARPVTAVIELFTSQGCSSCPAADALLKEIASKQKDVMALTLPVDIWDYIGWKDTLATAKNSERQRAYSRLLGSGPVYTPQVVIDGVAQTLGSDLRAIDMALKRATNYLAERQVSAQLFSNRNSVIIQIGDSKPNVEVKDATIWLAVVQKAVTVQIKRGENEGQTLTYHNVVQELTPVGVWSGKAVTIQLLRSAFMRPDVEKMVVLIQEADYGPIIGAAWLGL